MAEVAKKRASRKPKIGHIYRNKTLREMPPVTRKLARLRGELASIDKRLKKLVPEVKEVERVANVARKDSIEVLERLQDAQGS